MLLWGFFTGRGVPSQGGSGRRALLTGGGAGGDGEDNPPQGPSSQHSDPINDQIALILVRLQQDMTSVLDRLNRLEQQNRQVQSNPIFYIPPPTTKPLLPAK